MKTFNLEMSPIILAFFLMSLIIVMILPMPSIILDFGLVVSFGLAIMIMAMVIYSERVLEFSSFPSLLIISLMLRLSLNVNTTRLIIGDGHTGTDAAGDVIKGFGEFVMGGSLFLGLVIFCILLIVNFMVITKGSSRMAEVSARFALDGMPGRQLAIDSDLASGSISHDEAKNRREVEHRESSFFGSLDGVSKFVKGDAVAGLLITIINLIFGACAGIILHNMSFGEAVAAYSILTVGDGLVSQIPAVIISLSSGLLLAKADDKSTAAENVAEQLVGKPLAFFSVGVLLLILGLLPGMPFLPFSISGVAVLIIGGLSSRRLSRSRDVPEIVESNDDGSVVTRVGDFLDLEDLHVVFSSNLVDMALDPGTGLDARIANMRKYTAQSFGVLLPEIRLTDDVNLADGRYEIRIQGVVVGYGFLDPGRMLALLSGDVTLPGDLFEVREPVFGASACWITENRLEDTSLAECTVVSPCEVLSTHLLEIIKNNFDRLLTLRSLRQNLLELTRLTNSKKSQQNKELLDDLIPEKIKIEFLLSVLRLLLREKVSVRNLPFILETMVEGALYKGSAEATCEFVRQKLGFQIASELLRSDGTLGIIQLESSWEEVFSSYQLENSSINSFDVALPPEYFRKLSDSLKKTFDDVATRETRFVLVVPARRRRFLRTIMDAKKITTAVISYEEMGLDLTPTLVGTVGISDE